MTPRALAIVSNVCFLGYGAIVRALIPGMVERIRLSNTAIDAEAAAQPGPRHGVADFVRHTTRRSEQLQAQQLARELCDRTASLRRLITEFAPGM